MFKPLFMIPPSWAAQLAPIKLIEPSESAAAAKDPGLMVITLVVLLCVVMTFGYWRARRHRAPELEQAFRGLARRLKLGKRKADLVGKLADAVDVPAVVLLLSEHAFDQAALVFEPVLANANVPQQARAHARHRPAELSDAALASLKRTLFGDQ